MREKLRGLRDNRKIQLAITKRAAVAHSLRELEKLFSKPKKKNITLVKGGAK